MRGQWKFSGGWGLKSQGGGGGGGGVQIIKPSMGGVWIFSETNLLHVLIGLKIFCICLHRN